MKWHIVSERVLSYESGSCFWSRLKGMRTLLTVICLFAVYLTTLHWYADHVGDRKCSERFFIKFIVLAILLVCGLVYWMHWNKGGYVAKLIDSTDSVIVYRLKTINFKYSWTHPHRVFYVKRVCMRSWYSDVGCYVTVTKLLNSIFNVLLIFIRRWVIHTGLIIHLELLSALELTCFLNSHEALIEQLLGLSCCCQWQRKTKKLAILSVNSILNISSCILAHIWWVIEVIR